MIYYINPYPCGQKSNGVHKTTTHMEEANKEHFYEVINDMGRAIKGLREHYGLTTEQAAERAGVTVKKLEAIERGRLTTNLNYICDVVEGLGGRLAIVPEEQPTDPHVQFIEFDED